MGKRERLSLTAEERQDHQGIALTCLLGALLFFMAFWLSYHQLTDLTETDIGAHLLIAQGMTADALFQELLLGGGVLWYLAVHLLFLLEGSWVYAAATATAAAITAVYVIFCALLRRVVPLGGTQAALGAMALCLVSSIYLPWYSETIYRGQDSPNVWHSPTQIMVRPFAVLIFWMTVRIYRRWREAEGIPQRAYRSRGEAALYTVLIALSVWAKPSFFQVIVPALGVLLLADLVRSRGKSFPFAFKLAAAYVPGALLTGMKFIMAFLVRSESGELSVEIAPFDVWSAGTKCIPLSMLLLMAFPLFVMVTDRKRFFASAEGRLSLAAFAAAAVFKALLAEVGERRYHGNFGWGYTAAAGLLWLAAFCHFARMVKEGRLSGRRAWLGWALLALHLLSGLIYYILLASTDTMC